MVLKTLLAGLRTGIQGAAYSRPSHQEYARVLEAAVEDGTLSPDELSQIEIARIAAGGKLPDAKKEQIFNKLMDAILADGWVTEHELESARWLAEALALEAEATVGALSTLELLVEAQSIADGNFGPVDVDGVRLQKSEIACLKLVASLMGVRKRREYVGGSRGISLRIAKGVSYRVGASRGYSETIEDDVVEATGSLIVTSKRLIFASPIKSFSLPLIKIINLDLFSDGVIVHSESRQKPYQLQLPNNDGTLLGAAIRWADQK